MVKTGQDSWEQVLRRDPWLHSACDPSGTPDPPLVPRSWPASQHPAALFLSGALLDFGWRLPFLNYRTSWLP